MLSAEGSYDGLARGDHATRALRAPHLDLPEQGRRAGLRGGTFAIRFGGDWATVELSSARFAKDVAVSGIADYGFGRQAIDATVTGQAANAERRRRAGTSRSGRNKALP